MNIYVDSKLGDDIKGTGKRKKPFKTLSIALDKLNGIKNGHIVILVSDEVYNTMKN
jgi:hypothetical protein